MKCFATDIGKRDDFGESFRVNGGRDFGDGITGG